MKNIMTLVVAIMVDEEAAAKLGYARESEYFLNQFHNQVKGWRQEVENDSLLKDFLTVRVSKRGF